MATKLEKIAAFKLSYPTLRTGDEARGYVDLSFAEYNATLNRWADAELATEVQQAAKLAEDAAFTKDRADGLAKLEAAGLTPAQARAIARKDK